VPNTIGIGEARTCRTSSSNAKENHHANFALRQIGQLSGQAIIPTIREAVFDCDIATFGIAKVSKATAE
jgi:hypothetical protein